MLSLYGATSIFFFALPLVMGLFLYIAPLQVGARGTALPRLSQIGGLLWVAGAVVLYSGFLWTPSEAGVNPLPPLSELAFLSNNGVDAWLTACGFATLGFVLIAVDLSTTLRVDRAPGMAWRRAPIFAWTAAVGSWLMLFIGPVLLAAFTMLLIDRNYDGTFFADGGGGAPLLWQHFTWIFYSGAYMLVLIFAFAAVAEIFSVFSGNPIFNRQAVMTSIVAVAVIGTLAYMQNMYTAPIGIGWKYFGMLMSLALIVPVGLLFFNLIATLNGGALRMRAPVLFAVGALVAISVGLAAEMQQSLVGAAFYLKNTTDSTAATHFALIGGAVFGGFAALHFWFPKITGRTMGEQLGRLSFWTLALGHRGRLRADGGGGLGRGPGGRRLQVLQPHRRQLLQPALLDRGADPLHRGRPGPGQRGRQRQGRRRGRPRSLGRRHARVVRPLAAAARTTSTSSRTSAATVRCGTSATAIARRAGRSRSARPGSRSR